MPNGIEFQIAKLQAILKIQRKSLYWSQTRKGKCFFNFQYLFRYMYVYIILKFIIIYLMATISKKYGGKN